MMHNNDELNLQVEGGELEDYYETQPGDLISETTTFRKRKSRIGLGLVLLGVLLLIGGFLIAFVGKEEENTDSNSLRDKQPHKPHKSPAPVPSPTNPPVPSPTKPPVSSAPTHSPLFDMLKASPHVTRAHLANTDSVAHQAGHWLLNSGLADTMSDDKLLDAFALACLYIATSAQDTWVNNEGWVGDRGACHWYGVECENHLVTGLNLTSNGLIGTVPKEFAILSNTLTKLLLTDNDLKNEDKELSWMGSLTNLKMLEVESTNFKANGIPSYIGKLTELRILDVADTNFLGPLDGSVFAPLQNLIYLDIGDNSYNSTIPSELAELPKLEAFYAYDTDLVGDIDIIHKMKNAFELWVDNNDLIGSIPSKIGHLTSLASFSVSNNDIVGSIPTEIGKLTNMQQMWLFGNLLAGDVPSEIGAMAALKILGIEDNNLNSESIPSEICDLKLIAFGADSCCGCCTCCTPPCPIENLPLYDSRRRLQEVLA